MPIVRYPPDDTEEILADPRIEHGQYNTLWNHHHVTKAALEAGNMSTLKKPGSYWEGAKENTNWPEKVSCLAPSVATWALQQTAEAGG